jgi:hypothetical protein
LKNLRIAFFITPHGFGHAARSTAVMESLLEMRPDAGFEIFTTVPEFFFRDTLPVKNFNYHSLSTDIGLAQKSALVADLPETIGRLDRLLPFDDRLISDLAQSLIELGCSLVVSDIAAMGIAAAGRAGIPSLLIENFTWDWIYREYLDLFPELANHIDYLEVLFNSAAHHIRAIPAHRRGVPALTVPPISRKCRVNRNAVRKNLQVPDSFPMILISMGGVKEPLPFIEQLYHLKDYFFVVPGSPLSSRNNNVLQLPHDSDFYHPDLVDACNALIGKPGYSTVAEVYRSGVPFGYIPRNNFRESSVLESFIAKEIPGVAIDEEEFRSGIWIKKIPQLLSFPHVRRIGPDGASQAAKYILNIV